MECEGNPISLSGFTGMQFERKAEKKGLNEFFVSDSIPISLTF